MNFTASTEAFDARTAWVRASRAKASPAATQLRHN